ncbi:MAG: lipopolysaccharide biosynthesis protein [Erysipelotrichia bacterium]|nr:lipopolysaccharide biosynthesis protein [Erysipelotrichia bacterium]
MINLLFSGNEKVFDGVLTCLLSIYKRTTTKEPIRAYVLTMDISRIKEAYIPISDAQIDFLNQVAKKYNPDHSIIKIDVGDIYQKEFAYCPNEMAYCSPYTLLRLFIDLIPEIPEKILYLEVDIMFNRDIRELYDIDIEGYEYAAARDHYGKYLLNPNYINAGVLLFNMKKAKETKLFEKARHLIKTKKFLFADQSALYKATSKKKMLRQKYNDQKFLHKRTIVRHFSKRLFYLPYPHTDNIKQWHVEKIHKVFKYHQFDDILNEYLMLKADFSKIKGEK